MSITSRRRRPTLDPVATLQVPLDAATKDKDERGSRLSVSSICFLPKNDLNSIEASESDDDSSSDEEVSFRCRDFVRNEKRHDGDIAGARNAAASLYLSGTRLVSCHTNGDTFLWDLGQRRIVSNFCERRGQGLALRRFSAPSNNILYQTRDPCGTVTIHSVETMKVVTKFETCSLTFCTAAPCAGNRDLVVLPCADRCYATVRDVRISPESAPVVRLHGAGLEESENEEKHGMLTSVAMAAESDEAKASPVVCCGMESGSVFFHDLRMTSTEVQEEGIQYETTSKGTCSVTLGKDPVLGLDLASSAPTFGQKRSFVSIAGMAGDAAELSELPVEERGTVAVVKAIFGSDSGATARLRARVSTCAISGPDESIRGGKPGVSVCRFRPDGRVFGVGGWDRRVRIFDRTGNASPLAILKGHSDSITALDWAPDSQSTGYLATGAGDGKICIWRCFPNNH